MDNFVVSARKYRPSTFNSVVGQAAITGTLKNAIKNKHLAQAFLFCGPRGVGKTTCARILAKTINCTNLGPDTESCNQCESCVSFNNGQSLNIFELDAASNNSVDDMRNLVDQVRYAPQTGNYKIYIIDEVHMLSTAAFNAFLKTLEEPPPYAIFILATTEKHKIIPTILSRCQIFDFNRITIDDIARHLKWIADNENVSAEPEALHTIAQKADGALRDALSIFDQIVSFAGNHVTYKHVIDNLNILDYEYYFRITDYLIQGDFANALLLLNEIIDEGFDVHHFITGLSAHFRDLLVCKDPQTLTLLEVGEKTRERYKSQAQYCSPSVLFRFLEIGNRCDVEFKASQNQRLHAELALLKMCSLRDNAFDSSPAATEKKSPLTGNDPRPEKHHGNESPVVTDDVTGRKHPAGEVQTMAREPVSRVTEPAPKQDSATRQPKTDSSPAVNAVPVSPGTATTRKRAGTSASISISRKLQAVNTPAVTADEVVADTEVPEKPIDENQLTGLIKTLVERFQAEGRRQLAVALNKHEPRLMDGQLLEIAVDNPIQAEEIHTHKPELLGYLREKLSNYRLDIQTRITSEHDLKETAYTPAEKFSKMAEKNPDLNQLRQQFDLELDF